MAYRNPFDRQLGIDMPEATPARPQTEDDVERRRQTLKRLGMDDSALGRVNDAHGTLLAQRDQMRDDLRNRLLGQSGPSVAAAAGKSGGAASQAATTAASSAGMSALGASL